jgi:hypothetical protein
MQLRRARSAVMDDSFNTRILIDILSGDVLFDRSYPVGPNVGG